MTVLLVHATAVFSFMAAANVLNDIMDFEGDKINHPTRPLPSGRIDSARANQVAVIWIITSVLCLGFGISYAHARNLQNPWLTLPIWIAAGTTIMAYELGPRLKARGLSGNVAISALIGLSALYGGAALGELGSIRIWWIAACAMLVNLAREITKDCEDHLGDGDRNTLPQQIGLDSARHVVALISLMGLGLTIFGYGMEFLPTWTILAQTPTLFLLITLKPHLIRGNDRTAQRQLKAALSLGLLGFGISAWWAV